MTGQKGLRWFHDYSIGRREGTPAETDGGVKSTKGWSEEEERQDEGGATRVSMKKKAEKKIRDSKRCSLPPAPVWPDYMFICLTEKHKQRL